MKPQYTYRAALTRLVDGDTIYAAVDVGFRTYMVQAFRLYGINAPEMNTPEGQAAKEHLAELMIFPEKLILKTYKDPEKYGRWLCEIWLDDPTEKVSLNDKMIADGFAKEYKP